MIMFYVSWVSIVMQILGILGTPPVNHSRPTTVNPISSILSKFHQNDFKLTYERSEMNRIDPRYADCQLRTFKYNRTTPVTNVSCIFHINTGYAMEVIVQAYKFASNEYRLFPIRCEINFCDAIASSAFGLNLLVKNGNVVCPLVKEKKYYVNYFAPDPEQFPPLIPNGHYNLELQFLHQDKELFVVNNYGIVDRPISIPEF